ncbi:MAG: glycosyltransferase [Ignavibacteriales bacterium]|nr:glycosyltransferase [Ignavibacteriales bacterium]
MTKVIHLISSMSRGGRERQLATIVKYSTLNNVIVYFNEKEGNSYIDEYELSDKCFRINTPTKQRLSKLLEFIKENKPDVIIAWGNYEAMLSLLAVRGKDVKFINASVRHGIRLRNFSHYLRTFVLHFSPYIIANSHAGLRANNLKENNRRFVLYNGKESIYGNKISLEEKEKRLVEIFPEYNTREIVYISIANLVPYKDYRTVFKSLSEISAIMDFRYIILGEGLMRDELEGLAKELKINDRIYFAGRVVDVLYYLQIADLLIHSSKGEGISNGILEGMYSGLPVIATEVGGIPETVFNKTSLLFEYKSVHELVECLKKTPKLIENCVKYKDEFEEFIEKFSIPNMIKSYEKIIEMIINRG